MTTLPPVPRARRAALAVALCAGLTAVLTACGGTEPPPPDPDAGTNGVGKLTAAGIEAKARNAVRGAEAVRLAGNLVSKGGTYRLNMRLKGAGAAGSVVNGDTTFELLRVGDVLYLKADAEFWTHAEEASNAPTEADRQAAKKLGGKFVKVPEDDPSYKQLRGFTEMNTLLGGLLVLHGELHKGERDSIGGIRTIKVAGGPGGEGGTLDVSLEGTPYPLKFERGGDAGVVVLSDWNEDFALQEPSKEQSVDYGRQLPRAGG
ncbi:hypothetical protein [Streptomyces lichenis]|uniref:Lipoprotein n=1 Tax=Streptomyces lichenis TaxID=2306967 RepID=A0ABT0IF26_9ACTN|nr:hypothetical protein [Streptomyces lichenis]MCK8679862.1 hypothetical protein [Streptomyces lichenis]